MNTAVICIGSNIADKREHVRAALELLKVRFGEMAAASEIYLCPSHNGIGSDYANCVVRMITDNSLDTSLDTLKEMERNAGRTAESKITGVMPLDIDIVIWNDRILRPYDFERYHFINGCRQIEDKCRN